MGFHIHLRGKLEYPSPEDALAAHRQLVADADWILEDARVAGNMLVVSFENFVGDPSASIDRLVAAARTAVAGKIQYDDEAGEQMQIPAAARGIGHEPGPGEYVDKIRLAGSWTFANDDDTREAHDRLASALVTYPPRALSTKKQVLKLNFEGRGPERTANAVKRALFAIAPRAIGGTMRHQHLGTATVLDAPLPALDDGVGERLYVHYYGSLQFRNEKVRDEALSAASLWGATAKGKRRVVFDQKGTMSPTAIATVNAAVDQLVSMASDGAVYVYTAEGMRLLRATKG